MSYRHDIRKAAVHNYLKNKRQTFKIDGKDYKYTLDNGKWRLIKIEVVK